MIEIIIGSTEVPARIVLCLGAHCDSIEIGCGGTLRQIAQTGDAVCFHLLVFSSDLNTMRETEAGTRSLLGPEARLRFEVQKFRDGYFPYAGAEIKDQFESLEKLVHPDIIFLPIAGRIGTKTTRPPVYIRADLEYLSEPPDTRI
jgi:LmbE family N-acetylglucosaminyl deacetylase